MRRSIRLKSNKIIFISLILSMSIIGVGYTSWNDTTTINLSVKTGYIDKELITDEKHIPYKDGQYLTTDFDGRTLHIGGKVYPNFNEKLKIYIIDSGTVLSQIERISPLDNIHNISINNNDNDIKDSFEIKIKPDFKSNNAKMIQLDIVNLDNNDSIIKLNNEINYLNSNIDAYNKTGILEFNYTIDYELYDGIWEKKIYIIGNIEVVPDPKVQSEMLLKLEELQKLEEEKLKLKLQEELLIEPEINPNPIGESRNNDLPSTEKVGVEEGNLIPEPEDTLLTDEILNDKYEETISEQQDNIQDINNNIEEQNSLENENEDINLTGENNSADDEKEEVPIINNEAEVENSESLKESENSVSIDEVSDVKPNETEIEKQK